MTGPCDPVVRETQSVPAAGAATELVSTRHVSRHTFLKAAALTTAALTAGDAATGLARAAAPALIRSRAKMTLDFWHFKPELRVNTQRVLDAFHKDFPDITINQIPKPVGNYPQVLTTALAAGQGPDLFQIDTSTYPLQAKSGQLLDLTGHVPNIKNTLPIARGTNYQNGKLYSVTWGRYTVIMMYNKKYAAKFGLTPPRTWADWKAQCKAILKAGMTPISMAGDGSIDAFWFTELATSALGGKGYTALATGKKKYTDPELVETMRFVLDMVPYYQNGFLATKYADSKALFATEKVMYFEAGSADIPGFRNINPNLDIGVFAFPPPKVDGEHTTLSGLDTTVAASATTSHPEAVYAFENWCLSPKGATMCSSAISLSPVVKGVVPNVDPVQREIIKLSQTEDFHVWYEVPRMAPGFAIWAKQGQGIFTGRLNSMQLLRMMQHQSDAAAKAS